MARRKSKRLTKKELLIALVIVIIVAVAIVVVYKMYPELFTKNSAGEPPAKSGQTVVGENTVVSLPENATVTDSLGVDLDKAGLLTVHFIDVGQGDAIFIVLPDGDTMLIDAGSGSSATPPSEEKSGYFDYLESLSVKEIDYLIVSHPHADHINLLSEVLDEYQVNNIYYNDVPDNKSSATYKTFKQKAVSEPNVKTYKVDSDGEEGGIVYSITGSDYDYSFDLYACGYSKLGGDANSISIITVLDYQGVQTFFTGDAEEDTEEWYMDVCGLSTYDIDVLKVGHHGSDTSSSQEFLDFLQPEYAVISVGEGNSYGHPKQDTMDKFYDEGIVTYRTDKNGTVVLCIDYQGDFAFLTETSNETENNSLNRKTLTMIK